MKNTLGVHYHCWKNKPNVKLVLENFRKHYPDSPIRMVSDGGDDFTDLAKEYNCIFDYENINIYPKAIFIGHPIWKSNTTYEGAGIWLRRLYDTCKKLNTDWILLMEDDVLTINKIKNFPTVDGAGATNPLAFTPSLTNFLKERNSINQLWGYNMCGGAILNRKFYFEAYEKFINDFDIKMISDMDDRVGGWSDALINTFIIFAGGTTGMWDETIQTTDFNTSTTSAAFLHGDKRLYEEIQGSIYKIN